MNFSEIQMSNIIDNETAATRFTNPSFETTSVASGSNKVRNVKLVYCGDGVVEECQEDEEEKEKLELEEKQRQIELRKQMDLESKNMTWAPWFGYMAVKSATRSLEACDYMGERLAWWLGITKPKFLYEIEEYQRMQKEAAEINEDDIAEEIVIGIDGNIENKTYLNNHDQTDINKRLYKSNSLNNTKSKVTSNSRNIPEKLFQNND